MKVRKLYHFDQDEAARSVGEGAKRLGGFEEGGRLGGTPPQAEGICSRARADESHNLNVEACEGD